MDEFEFKPITEGLGFNKTKTKSKTETDSRESLFERSALDIDVPLPAKKDSKIVVDEILSSLSEKKNFDFLNEKEVAAKPKVAATTQNQKIQTTLMEVPAAILDFLLVAALSLSAVIGLLVATEIDLMGVLTGSEDPFIYLPLFAVFASMTWSYLVATRLYMGQTVGEWVFDQKLGSDETQKQTSYGLRVAARTTITILTGFFVIPFVSLVIGKDFLGRWLKVELIKA